MRVHLPLKQGLRQPDNINIINIIKCASASSIKTRIKTQEPKRCTLYHPVRVHLPLKQGLRPVSIFLLFYEFNVRVHLPLKQGLRQFGVRT